MAQPPPTTFDAYLMEASATRAFWGTLCEEVGGRIPLPPPFVAEILTHVRADAAADWDGRLRAGEHGAARMGAQRRRRLAALAGNAARASMRKEMLREGAIYAMTPPPPPGVERRAAILHDAMPAMAFDLSTWRGLRDRTMATEALSWGFDLVVASTTTIDFVALKEWIEGPAGCSIPLASTIMRPQEAEGSIRAAHNQPLEWTALAAARASVVKPDDDLRSPLEMMRLLDAFEERGMGEMRGRIDRIIHRPEGMRAALAWVKRHGNSRAMQCEARVQASAEQALARSIGSPPRP